MKRLLSLIAFSLIITTPLLSAENTEALPDLEGSWSGKVRDVVELSFAFTKEGQVTYKIIDPGFRKKFPDGFVGKYKIVASKPYSQIDMTDFNNPRFKDVELLGIVEIIDSNSIKMDFVRNRVGDPPKRPEKFTKEAVVLKKVKK